MPLNQYWRHRSTAPDAPVVLGPFLDGTSRRRTTQRVEALMALCVMLALDLEPQHAVLGQADATDGRFSYQAAVGSMPIVGVGPGLELSGPVVRGVHN